MSSTRNGSSAESRVPALGLIGCGAIAEILHLPALARHRDVMSNLVLVDPDLERARSLATHWGAKAAHRSHTEVLEELDGAIVAVPPRLHHPIALASIRAGVPVLCEKPLAESSTEAAEIVAEARRAGVALALNQTRRLFSANQRVKQLLSERAIGRPRRIDYQLGEPFEWPAVSASYFGAKGSGKGVLLDNGAHIVDLVCWWLGGRPTLQSYRDDSFGGTEAVVEVVLQHEDCTARIRLSWLSKLENAYRIEGESGWIESGAFDWSSLRMGASGKTRTVRTDKSRAFEHFGHLLIDNFIDVVRGRAQPLVEAADVLPSLELIDECYAHRTRFDMPWHEACQRISHV